MFAVSNTVVYAYRVSAYRVLYDVKKINFRHTYGAYYNWVALTVYPDKQPSRMAVVSCICMLFRRTVTAAGLPIAA